MSPVRVGTCAWSDHTDFYPKGLPSNQQITYYSQRFSVVEINSSYYRMMPERNYRLWAERTPDGFCFDVKPYRQITWHDRKNPPDDGQTMAFRDSLQPLRDAGKLGAVHMQFPPWFVYRPENVDYIKHMRDLFEDRLGVEFRHRSWLEGDHVSELLTTLREAGVSLTVVDEPQLGSGTVPKVVEATDPEIVIMRFHGRNYRMWYKRVKRTAERFDYLYSEDELRDLANDVVTLSRSVREVHALFNNNARDYAVRNSRQLRMLLREMLDPDQVIASPIEPLASG